MAARDYYEFVVVDRTPGRVFDLLDVVADALSKLKGDPSFGSVLQEAVAKYVPAEEQRQYLELAAEMNCRQDTAGLSGQQCTHSLMSRVRSWDMPNTLRAQLAASLQDPSRRMISPAESRLIEQVTITPHGVIERVGEYEPVRTWSLVVRGADGRDDVYFPYDLGPLNEQALQGSVLDFDSHQPSLPSFAAAFQQAHPQAVFAKGSIHVPYCAWPMPALTTKRRDDQPPSQLNFRTPEGRLYRWKALPFDMPLASRVWQVYVNHELNSRQSFACLQQTTLLVCAETREDAADRIEALAVMGAKHGWSFSIPAPASWLSDISRLGLDMPWEGVRPGVT
ncbi:hypothetical protein SEUCBS140593_005486 [Sporothrix eucalyptigena]|uniref:Uncharacterized protein n=1 Tax=Sporothrix eucalyptigena TaxID=1812306 RepID=A0ABP0BYM6_9PEZI